MQRAGIEGILGIHIEGVVLRLDPCIPKAWPAFDVTLRRGRARYEVHIDNRAGVSPGIASASLDGIELTERPLRVALIDDGGLHRLTMRLGLTTSRRRY